jgi:SARP family transcriptional regulator, regulator of embCAB operon
MMISLSAAVPWEGTRTEPDNIDIGPSDGAPGCDELVTLDGDPGPDNRYSISLLGSFGCVGPDGPIHLSAGTQRIVAFLALCGSPLGRSFVAGSLWPEIGEASAAAALRKQLWRLGTAQPGLVTAERTSLRLGEGVTVDFHVERARFHNFLRKAHEEIGEGDLDQLHQVGPAQDLLPGWYEDWVIVEQERWRQLRVHALEKASEIFCSMSRWAAAVDTALAAAATDPFRESAVRLLIEALVAEGNVLEAARSFESFRTRVLQEFGVGVSSEFRQWLTGILNGHRSEFGTLTG